MRPMTPLEHRSSLCVQRQVVAVGNSCHVLREIGPQDNQYFYKRLELDFNPDSDELPR